MYSSLIASSAAVGTLVGAMFGGSLAVFGHRRIGILLNILLVLGVIMTLFKHLIPILIGRFIYGLTVGCFQVLTPSFITEVTPVSLRGPMGSLSQFMTSLGILLAYLSAFIVLPVNKDDLEETDMWRIVFGLPAIFAILQLLLYVFVFKLESPIFYERCGNSKKLEKYYKLVLRSEKPVETPKQVPKKLGMKWSEVFGRKY